MAAEQEPDGADGHRPAHVKEQARARLQVPEGRAGVPFRVPGRGGIAVNREIGELVVLALTVPVRIERHCADRFKHLRALTRVRDGRRTSGGAGPGRCLGGPGVCVGGRVGSGQVVRQRPAGGRDYRQERYAACGE